MAKNEVVEQKQTQLTESEKFQSFVIREFGSQVSGINEVSDYQKKLIQGYFIGIDRALKVADENRIAKNSKCTQASYKNDLPITWNTVDLGQLALDVKHYSKMGLDMMQTNHLVAIPYKQKDGKHYSVTFIKGYNGIKYVADKYALHPHKNVITELVYKNDIFKPIKKSASNNVENYEFEIVNPFDRGECVGGFGYIVCDDPTMNKLIILDLAGILKRKPKYAAAEFWGGKAKGYENGKQVDIETDGWKDEMYKKTLERYVYGEKHIEIDPEKVDEDFIYMKQAENRYMEIESMAEIEENANSEEFVIDEPVKNNSTEKEKEVIETVDSEVVDEGWQKES